MNRNVLVLMACLAFAIGTAPCVRADPIADIRRLYETTNRQLGGASVREFVVTVMGNWRAADQEDKRTDQEKAAEPDDGGAKVYVLNGRPVRVDEEVVSPSGDFGISDEYYLYDNLLVAFHLRIYRIVSEAYAAPDASGNPMAPMPHIVEVRWYLSRTGSVLRELKKAFSGKTRQPLPPEKVYQAPQDWFVSFTQFPYYRLFAGGGGSH